MDLDTTERLAVRLRVFVTGNTEGRGFVTNLSPTGCQLQASIDVPRGSYIGLLLILGDGEEAPSMKEQPALTDLDHGRIASASGASHSLANTAPWSRNSVPVLKDGITGKWPPAIRI
jgi:hypothetical protein